MEEKKKKIDHLLVNSIYSGFRLARKEVIAELDGTACLFEHIKSGAQLLYIQAADTNKVFSISFRTPPKDSTGVAHILEHSVLCGSRKFPLKEPFVELVKGSLNTFLNAMTYPDKTMYPVASKNDQDFHNLMDVYLDAVFYPRVATDKGIVMQEGWHYELEHKEDPLTYKGVVYNEMKGVFSSPDAILERHMMEALFPDTTYGVESGGDPDYITDLTYDGFVDFYHQYYHPSNSYIFLYGDMNIEEQLAFIDEEYLQHFEVQSVDSSIGIQQPFEEAKMESHPYGIASTESEEGKSYHALTYVLSDLDEEKRLAFEILTHALLTSPSAPLKQLLIKEGVGADVSGYFLDSIRQPIWNITINGSELAQQEKIQNIVEAYLTQLVQKGIDTSLLEASLNTTEFALREAEFGGRPIGLAYNIRVMDHWLYGKDPISLLRYEDALRSLRQGLHNKYFETLIDTYLLKNKHKALVSIYPQKGILEEKERQETEKLAKIKESLTEAELETIIEETKALKLRQETLDSEEALQTIPLLSLDDLDPTVETIERKESALGGATLHFIPTFTKGIDYVDFYFDLTVLTEDEIFYAQLLAEMIGRVNTKSYSYEEIDKQINLHLGGFSVDVLGLAKDKSRDEIVPLISVKVKALHSKCNELVALTDELLLQSDFTDVHRLEDIVGELKAVLDAEAFRRGHTMISTRVLAQISNIAKFQEQSELTFYKKVVNLLKDKEALTALPDQLNTVREKLFRTPQLNLAFVGGDTERNEFSKAMLPVLDSWPQDSLERNQLRLTEVYPNEGIVTAGKVQYVAKGGNFIDHGYTFTGAMSVLETILRYEYLWTRIRVQGGAYGAFANFYNNGNVLFCSYRDPNLKESLQVYDEMAEYLRGFDISEREMRKYIIGTMSRLDLPMTPAIRGPRAMGLFFKGSSEEKQMAYRKEVINCKKEDIVALADIVEAVMKDNRVGVMGNEQKINEAKEYFAKINSLPN